MKLKHILLAFGLLVAMITPKVVEAQIKTFLSPTSATFETVTSTGTAYLTSPVVKGPAQSTTVQVVVTKTSGTVGGTISLLGSLDNVNFKAIVTEETQTALATITAADASATYSWRLKGNPYQYYRVSWTGSSGQVATFTATSVTH